MSRTCADLCLGDAHELKLAKSGELQVGAESTRADVVLALS